MNPETTISEEIVFTGKLFTCNVRQAKLADGTVVEREIVSTRGAVTIVAVTANHELRLLRQFRAAAGKWILELPGGGLEEGEDPDLAAPRELLEETGDHAATWHKLGGIYTASGIMTEYLHLYLATDLTPGPLNLEFDEHIELLTVPWQEVLAMVRRGEIEDARTVAGILMAGLHLGLIGGGG